MISALLSTSRHARRHAFDRLPHDRESAFAAREILTFDEDASVRARAAFFLAHAPSEIALPALRDALDDEMPLVRHAAVRAITTLGDASSFDVLAHVAMNDPIWWVRRAAVVACATLGKEASVGVLRDALEDPFWRVRAAAVRALLVFGVSDLGDATSARSAGALSYIARRLGAQENPTTEELDVPNAIVARLDPDPAIVTARIERGDQVTTAFLVECLGDPHQSLRVTAKKRLARSHDIRAFELALWWLDEPRIPHAAKTVIELLDSLDREDVDRILDIAFTRGGFGALCWAASYVALTRDESRVDALLSHANAEQPILRCAVLSALGEMGSDERVYNAIISALKDADLRVVRSAVEALWKRSALDAVQLGSNLTPQIRRVLAAAAIECEDVHALRKFSKDEDAHTRAAALTARAALDDLNARDRETYFADPDPWIRSAVLDEKLSARALASDPQPWVRRAAFRILCSVDAHHAGQLASHGDDPVLQTRACALLDPHLRSDLVSLLRLSRHASPAVRAAAADALERKNIDDALDAILASSDFYAEHHAQIRIAALVHRSRHFDDSDFDRIRTLENASPTVRAWIDDVCAPAKAIAAEEPVRKIASSRPLGAGTSRVILSGAGMLPTRAYANAMHAGCNLFFWEPRYHTLGRMLARDRSASVVAGTYEASERAIVADVDRYLRRLHRDAIDVFLLFWARSPARVDTPLFEVLTRLKDAGKIRAFGFSTHDRNLACDAISKHTWDVIMTRHSAAHPGAEDRLFPLAKEKNVSVLGFSALSYGRVLSSTIRASDAYRYSLAQPGVSAVLSSPRTEAELEENLSVLNAPPLSIDRQNELRAHGKIVHEASRDFARSIRRHPIGLADTSVQNDLTTWLDHQETLDPRFE